MISVLNRLRSVGETLWAVIPSMSWMRYAAMRLGTFIMSYAVTVAAIVIGFASAGIALSIGAIIAIIPIAVFLAIRISGVLAGKY